jgi:hypothetical protein
VDSREREYIKRWKEGRGGLIDLASREHRSRGGGGIERIYIYFCVYSNNSDACQQTLDIALDVASSSSPPPFATTTVTASQLIELFYKADYDMVSRTKTRKRRERGEYSGFDYYKGELETVFYIIIVGLSICNTKKRRIKRRRGLENDWKGKGGRRAHTDTKK